MSKLCKMGIAQDGGTKFFAAGWSIEAKPCDYCKSAAALLFCRADSAFMCLSCDARIHDKLMRSDHPRVWMCEVCEHAPAAFTCKADAATLCVACDRDIHAANPLARRHDRVAVVPFYDTAESLVLKSAAATLLEPIYDTSTTTTNMCLAHEGVFPDSWISPNPTKIEADTHDVKSFDFLLSDSDPFLEFNDSVVPVQTFYQTPGVPTQLTNDPSTENRFEIDFSRSNISYTAPSLSHSMSSSSMDVGVVPDGSSMSDTSYLNGNQSSQVVGMDREARVLRYREKRKNRKFEKTIRYASRKAYAETRPRVKGRFAKRNDADSDINRILGAEFDAGAGYSVVPSF